MNYEMWSGSWQSHAKNLRQEIEVRSVPAAESGHEKGCNFWRTEVFASIAGGSMHSGAVSRNMVVTCALSVMLLLTTQLMPALGLASLPATDFKQRNVTAQDFRMLAQATTSGQGGKRALLQNTAFSENLYLILAPILEGNSGTTVAPAALSCCRLLYISISR